MKYLLPLLFIVSIAHASDAGLNAYFERPISCPLRFSRLSTLRDNIQTLNASLSIGCTQSGQQALNQLNSSVSNLEGIATSWNSYQKGDPNSTNTVFAKNLNQILGSLNIITSNNACFYDFKSRGALPVLADVIMSISQFGLLVPYGPGMLLASGGFVVGSGMRITHQLIKKKFNWNRPEERRAFLQLNCSFYDNRRVMEEMGIFNPETDSYKDEILKALRKDRQKVAALIKKEQQDLQTLEEDLYTALQDIPSIKADGLDPLLAKKLTDLLSIIAQKPSDHPSKLRQVNALSLVAEDISDRLDNLRLDPVSTPVLDRLKMNIKAILPDLQPKARAWTCSIDEYEFLYRGPIMAFLETVSVALNTAISRGEIALGQSHPDKAHELAKMKLNIRESKNLSGILKQRLLSLESKITSLEISENIPLFADFDEGKSDSVEILDYYHKLMASILGKEGKGYLRSSISVALDIKNALDQQLRFFDQAKEGKEKCSAAEKLRFAWTQYRYKVQEAHDFVATNLDLYRSNFKVGKERLGRSKKYVLLQISSVEDFEQSLPVVKNTLGYLMYDVQNRISLVEDRLYKSSCF